jgi:hypothetical protein
VEAEIRVAFEIDPSEIVVVAVLLTPIVVFVDAKRDEPNDLAVEMTVVVIVIAEEGVRTHVSGGHCVMADVEER